LAQRKAKAGLISQVQSSQESFLGTKKRLGLDSSDRYKALKRVPSARKKARAGLICQVKSSEKNFLVAKKG
jgi:hypothetical protein